jgi:RNA-directed DNA polymerase
VNASNRQILTSVLTNSAPLLLKPVGELKAAFLGLQSARGLTDLLEIKYSTLIFHLFKKTPSQKYVVFEIPKKRGGTRTICAPISALKLIQRKLNYILQQVYEPNKCVHGFVFAKSIVSNAKMHTGRRYVLNVDLEDFFPSINFGRVRGMFMGVPYKMNSQVATYLAKICCYEDGNKGFLPQGAPTSPVVSNMLCAKMDSQLTRLAKDNLCRYSRYADDLTFSTAASFFPTGLAKFISIQETAIGGRLNYIIEENGFKVNLKKVRLQTNSIRQEVTGLTTNKFSNVKRAFIRQIRAMLHAWGKFGYDRAEEEYLSKYKKTGRGSFMMPPSFQNVVRGKIEFVGMVRSKEDVIYKNFKAKFDSLPKPQQK